MGRYDKIKVYNNNNWVQPTRIRVYKNGVWQDLGDNNSDNITDLNVRKDDDWVRATLNKQTTTSVTDRWEQGGFNVLPVNGFNANPKDGYGFQFYTSNVLKTENVDQNLFRVTTSASNSYLHITWHANGTVSVTINYLGSSRTVTSSNAVSAGTNVYINIWTWRQWWSHDNTGEWVGKVTIDLNGVQTSGTINNIQYGNSSNVVGDSKIQFRGSLYVKGIDGYGAQHEVNFNANTGTIDTRPSGSDGWRYQNLTHRETTTTVTNWV